MRGVQRDGEVQRDGDCNRRVNTKGGSAKGSVHIFHVLGLNVYSMLKHETLVLTLAAVEKIEHKLLIQMNRREGREHRYNSKFSKQFAQPHSILGMKI